MFSLFDFWPALSHIYKLARRVKYESPATPSAKARAANSFQWWLYHQKNYFFVSQFLLLKGKENTILNYNLHTNKYYPKEYYPKIFPIMLTINSWMCDKTNRWFLHHPFMRTQIPHIPEASFLTTGRALEKRMRVHYMSPSECEISKHSLSSPLHSLIEPRPLKGQIKLAQWKNRKHPQN